MTISRRHFLGSALAVPAAAGFLRADPIGIPPGFQVYPVREALLKDFDGTLREVAAIGYKNVEMCSPPGYGWKPLIDIKPADMKARMAKFGLTCVSCHYNFRELKESLDDRIAFAKELGTPQMVCSSFGLRRDATLADWMKAAEDLNKAGEAVHKAGMQLGYHNHDGEFAKIDGALIYDQLMGKLDPKLVKMQFQVSVVSLGFQAADFMTRYPGRFCSLHLQDWSTTEKKQVPVGTGVVDWKRLFTAAKKGGVKNYFVEMDLNDMKASYPYLHELKV